MPKMYKGDTNLANRISPFTLHHDPNQFRHFATPFQIFDSIWQSTTPNYYSSLLECIYSQRQEDAYFQEQHKHVLYHQVGDLQLVHLHAFLD
mmetsp:Transcript_5595/g.7404  ORF Transcript_5595/g.7404 Transcript_5595/m.7404 type:complete len:92 (-) Transcript_5595:452-727(-)